MDETDLRLFQLVSADARQSYREMAEKLGLTVQAVHRRMKAIEDEGILHCFTAHLSVPYLGAVPVYMSGISRATSVDAVLEGLRADDSVELVMTSSGSRLFICSLLRGISDLEPHLDIVRKAAMLEEPFPMGIEGVIQMGDRAISRPPRKTIELSGLDYRIIHALRADSRTAVADIAKTVGVSAKTVARRLDRMNAENVIEYRALSQLGAMAGSAGMIIINLKPGTDRTRFRKELKDALGQSLLAAETYTNLPDLLLGIVWAPTNAGFSELVEVITKNAGVASATSHVIYKEYHFDTWRDKLVAEKARKG